MLENSMTLPERSGGRFLNNFFQANAWGQGNGRSMMVTSDAKLEHTMPIMEAMADVGKHGVMKDVWDIDVKDLLETGRVIIEKSALDTILYAHASDLGIKANLEFAFRANKELFLQNALPISDALQFEAEQAMLNDMLDEDEFYMGDNFEADVPQSKLHRKTSDSM